MSFLFSFVGKKILAESARNHFGQDDPYFEEVPASGLGRAFGKKTQKKRKAIPHGLSENDSKILTRVKRRAYRLDYCLFNFCGIRFGWGSVIGIVPFIGDAADAALAMMVLKSCEGVDGGLPSRIRMQMIFNIIIDFLIGLVPFVGDIADAAYKCNTRNAVILEKYLRDNATPANPRQGRNRGAVSDSSLPSEYDGYGSENAENTRHDKRGKPFQRSQSQKSRSGKARHGKGDLESGIIDDPPSRA
ncbi:hypothetical protein BJX99DRAFT_204212 [Aspergillus californicus]